MYCVKIDETPLDELSVPILVLLLVRRGDRPCPKACGISEAVDNNAGCEVELEMGIEREEGEKTYSEEEEVDGSDIEEEEEEEEEARCV